ncbi:Lipase 1 [Zhongshania aliphaticivorans]|uniref:Lipase 1 n=1 Tax=Zhongshania aliphaticivorans TaxID=1470434 RepID=A0A5S9QSZ4_9GAMM|nr:alpha/beta hydrolase [Zhongshania aliphaticivorans]CAA0110104.1 Lipase 1 [Zhongshania aliphaticivorans]CAA0117998.1 Lipase 1 [Zhongshania aliphaticivorans]CAA0121880.1 Lipase 1 [Zhongshania aliphaticivorans]
MKKSMTVMVIALVAIVTAWSLVTYPRVGGEVLNVASRLETAVYGLQRAEIDISDSKLMSWQGGPSEAEAVIMLHGYSADKTVWMRFARYFLDDYRVVILDLPGHGETAFDPELKYDTRSQGQRVIEVMDALGVSRAHIIGNSMGGFIAAQLALHHAKRVLTATLIDPAGVVAPQASDMEKMLAEGRNPFEIASREEFDEFYAMTMAQPPWLPRMVLDYMADDYILRRESLVRIFEDFHSVDMLDSSLGKVRVPVLIMWGERDRLLHFSSAEVWRSGIEGAELVSYPELGHMPMLEAPERSARDVLKFFDKQQ